LLPSTLEKQFENTKPGDAGIIGDPVAHSLSPVMQNVAFQTLKQAMRSNSTYHKFHIKPEQLKDAFKLVKKYQLRGVNVTVPHKIEACQYMDHLDPFAKKSGAINTVQFKDEKLKGFNTDGDGFFLSTIKDLEINPEGMTCFVFGAGGTGRVAILKLFQFGAKVIYCWNRSKEKVENILSVDQDLKKVLKGVDGLGEVNKVLEKSDFVVNTTSLGLTEKTDHLPLDGIKFHKGQKVLDVIYHRKTEFMKQAENSGAQVVGGLGMLLHQGARAFEIWTGTPAPYELMKQALDQSIKQG